MAGDTLHAEILPDVYIFLTSASIAQNASNAEDVFIWWRHNDSRSIFRG